MYDIIVVGAGPAGMTAALYALRANKKVLILESKNYGGQIFNATKVENYPGIELISGYDFATNLYNQVKKLGGEFIFETVLSVSENKEVITRNKKYIGKAVILATGVINRKLSIEGENTFAGKGISYCATCDGNFFKNKEVAVNGGGNSALEDAIYLADIAKKVFIIHRRDNFKGENKYINELKSKNNVEYIFNSNIIKINGTNKLESIEIIDNDNNTRTINVAGLFIAIGHEPKNTMFKNVVDLDEKGYFISKDGLHTKIPGIYIAGDARVKTLRQLTTAVSDGSIAATTAIKEMN